MQKDSVVLLLAIVEVPLPIVVRVVNQHMVFVLSVLVQLLLYSQAKHLQGLPQLNLVLNQPQHQQLQDLQLFQASDQVMLHLHLLHQRSLPALLQYHRPITQSLLVQLPLFLNLYPRHPLGLIIMLTLDVVKINRITTRHFQQENVRIIMVVLIQGISQRSVNDHHPMLKGEYVTWLFFSFIIFLSV